VLVADRSAAAMLCIAASFIIRGRPKARRGPKRVSWTAAVWGTLNRFTSNVDAFGNCEHLDRTGAFARRVLSIQQEESPGTMVRGLNWRTIGPAPRMKFGDSVSPKPQTPEGFALRREWSR